MSKKKLSLGQLWKEPIERNFNKTVTSVVRKRVYGDVKPLSKPFVNSNAQLPPVKDGYVRIFHGTSVDNLNSLDQKGLLFGKDVKQREQLYEVLFSVNPKHKWGDVTIAADIPKDDKYCDVPHDPMGWGSCRRRLMPTEIVGYIRTNEMATPDDLQKTFSLYKKSIQRAVSKGYKVPQENLKFFNME